MRMKNGIVSLLAAGPQAAPVSELMLSANTPR